MCSYFEFVKLRVKGLNRVDQVSSPMVCCGVVRVEYGNVVDDGVNSANPVDDGIVVLYVHMCGGVVVERVNEVDGVVFTFKLVIVRNAAEVLVDSRTEAWYFIGCVFCRGLMRYDKAIPVESRECYNS